MKFVPRRNLHAALRIFLVEAKNIRFSLMHKEALWIKKLAMIHQTSLHICNKIGCTITSFFIQITKTFNKSHNKIFLFRQTVAEFLDLTLLKDLVFDNIVFGMALAFFADLTFFTLEPLFLVKNHLSKVRYTQYYI